MPPTTSSTGVIIRRSLSGAHSERNIELVRPTGPATSAPINVTNNVTETKGKTP